MENSEKPALPSIREIIVVEGRNDTLRLRQYFNVDTIETGGVHFPEDVIEQIREAQKRRGVIVFTDPDYAGEKIRSRISRALPEVRHAFIPKEKARGTHKIGVEHAGREAIQEALENCVTFDRAEEGLSWDEYLDLGIIGNRQKRAFVCEAFHIGPCSAKVCYKRLNRLGITKKEIETVMETFNE